MSRGLRVQLLLRPYDTMAFHLEKRTITYPNGEIHQQVLDIIELDDDSGPRISFRASCQDEDCEADDNVRRKAECRQHQFIERDKPVGRGHTMDMTYTSALWEIQRFRKKTVYQGGTIAFYEHVSMVPFGDFMQWKDSRHNNGGPPTSRKATLRLCRPEGGFEYINIEVSGKPSETLVMDATASDSSFALKFSLTIPVPGAKEEPDLTEGILEIMSKGLEGFTRDFIYLRDLMFVLWLIYTEEDRAYSEK